MLRFLKTAFFTAVALALAVGTFYAYSEGYGPQALIAVGLVVIAILYFRTRKMTLRVNGLVSCALGAILCGAIAWTQYYLNWLGAPDENKTTIAFMIFGVLYFPGFIMPGGFITPLNFDRVQGFAGAQHVRFTIGSGPAWALWFFLIWTITSIKDQRPAGVGDDADGKTSVPLYFIFNGKRNVLPAELGEEVNKENVQSSQAPEVVSADQVSVKIPISGDYEVMDAYLYTRTENAEVLIQGETLAALRNTAAKFAYVDLLRMKTVITGLVSGFFAILVLRGHDAHGDRGHILRDKFDAPIFVKLPVPFSTSVEEELAKPQHGSFAKEVNRLKKVLCEKYNKGRADADKKTVAQLETDGVFDLIYTAGERVTTMLKVGTLGGSIQTRNAVPTDPDILAAGAKIETAKLNRITMLIKAKATAKAAEKLKEGLAGAVDLEEAARLNRVTDGHATEEHIHADGDALLQVARAFGRRP